MLGNPYSSISTTEMQKNVANKPPRQYGFLTIDKVKTVLIPIKSPVINRKWFFNPDEQLTRSVITGIRCLSLDYRRSDITMVTGAQQGGFCLTIVDHADRKIIDGVPWYSYVAANDAAGNPIPNQKRAFTKCNFRMSLDKCYVENYQDPSFPDDGVTRYMAVEFAYKPFIQ